MTSLDTVEEFLPLLSKKDIKLWTEDGDLRVSAPKGVLTSDILAQLKQRKQEILTFLMRRNQGPGEADIPRANRDEPLPLSFTQQRMWFLDQLDPEQSIAYNLPSAVQMDGLPDLMLLDTCFNEILLRHEVFRTRFPAEAGVPVLRIEEEANQTLNVIDVSGLSDERATEVTEQLCAREVHRGFNLATGPLIHIHIVRQSTTDHLAFWNVHHICSDGWSTGIFLRELAAIYDALIADKPSPLAPLPLQYVDYASWQRQSLQGGALERGLAFWRESLAGAPRLLDMPTDRPRPAAQSFQGDSLRIDFPGDALDRLQRFCRRTETTLFMLLESAWAALLYRYSGQNDILVGVPVANRPQRDLEELIGFFANTLVLRNDLTGNPSFSTVLDRCRERTLAAFGHQSIPFEKVVDALQPERTLAFSPLFQVLFVFMNTPGRQIRLPGLRMRQVDLGGQPAKFDLSLFVAESDGKLTGQLEYSTDLFDQETIARLASHYTRFLDLLIEHPHTAIEHLDFLSEDERNTLLLGWNAASPAERERRCAHEWFADVATAHPTDEALIDATKAVPVRYTYRDLQQASNALAAQLMEAGHGPGSLVGILMPRSFHLVVAILAVHRIGAGYIPLDPAYPAERLHTIVRDAGQPLILTAGICDSSLLPEDTPNLDVTHLGHVTGTESEPAKSSIPGHLSHVIYTSGSTGRPKGVAIGHSALTAMLAWAGEAFPAQAWAGVLASTSVCFDLSLFELYGPLTQGGKIILADSALELPNLACREEVVLINTVPSVIAELIGRKALPASVTHVNLAGEALRRELVDRIYEQATVAHVYNLYGPSEDTTYSVYTEVARQDMTEPPIGKPIRGTQAYVLSPQLYLQPRLSIGELGLTGDGLARGYLHRAGATAASFVPNPFGPPGSRLYKTGDLVRYNHAGTLLFLGRRDHQVKLRGFRIELGELETVLTSFPAVDRVAVVMQETPAGRQQLTAFVTTKEPPADPDRLRDELRGHLAARLPIHMVLSHFVFMDRLPETPNGKIDRRALAAESGEHRERNYVPPRNEQERMLSKIWGELLGRDQVGIEDNFFELGGDSILSVQAVARAAAYGLHFTTKQMFEWQTIAQLCAVADRTAPVHAEQGVVTGSAPITAIQHWFLSGARSKPQFFNQAVLLDLTQTVPPERLAAALDTLAGHHDALRTRFHQRDGVWTQTIGPREPVPLEQLSIETESKAARESQILETSQRLQASLDLQQGPLFRAAVFQGPTTTRLLLIAHHLIIDGLSWRILLEDLERLCLAPDAPDQHPLPAKTSSYLDWARAQPAHPEPGEASEPFGSAGIPLDMPCNPADNTPANTAVVTRHLDSQPTAQLLANAGRAYRANTEDLLMTALFRAVTAVSGAGRLVVDLEGHGRDHNLPSLDIGRTVGWFTTIRAVEVALPDSANRGEWLKTVKESLRRDERGHGVHQRAHSTAGRPLVFNYLGQTDALLTGSKLFGRAEEATGESAAADDPRPYLVEINALVANGQLTIAWQYCNQAHHAATIETLADRFIDELTRLIEHCQAPNTGGRTPSDVPLAGLDQVTLDRLWKQAPGFEDIYPLSPMQSGILFHALDDPDGGHYFNQFACCINGPLDLDRFEASWRQALRRHAVLRTTFPWEDLPQPLQLVHGDAALDWVVTDSSTDASIQGEDDWQAMMAADRQRGFSLTEPPLTRFRLHIEARDESGRATRTRFLWSFHHLLLDGWSVSLLLREIFASYRSGTTGVTSGSSAMPRYRDYIAWVTNLDAKGPASYWQQRLAGFHTANALPMLELGTAEPAADFTETESMIPAATISALSELCRQHRLTPSNVFRGMWALMLHHYSQDNDLLFGATVAGRPPHIEHIEAMLGLFINTVPVRIGVNRKQRVLTWLAEIQAEDNEARDYQYTPLNQIQRWSEVAIGDPLFDSLLVFENYPVEPNLQEADEPLSLDQIQVVERSHYPLTLVVMTAANYTLNLKFDRQRFTTAVVDGMLRGFTVLLDTFVKDPSRQVGQFSLLTPAERQHLVSEWNQTEVVFEQAGTIRDLVAEQVKRTPNASALVVDPSCFDGQTPELTYRELWSRVTAQAQRLRRHGLGPGDVAGIFCSRSLSMVTAILGVLEAGAAYLPLDPEYPKARTAFMLEDAGAKAVLAQPSLMDDLPAPTATVLDVTDCPASPTAYDRAPVGSPGTELEFAL